MTRSDARAPDRIAKSLQRPLQRGAVFELCDAASS
jgi:hypothetical protein